jgi:hypothetical protein
MSEYDGRVEIMGAIKQEGDIASVTNGGCIFRHETHRIFCCDVRGNSKQMAWILARTLNLQSSGFYLELVHTSSEMLRE